jgi:hypothetical protein
MLSDGTLESWDMIIAQPFRHQIGPVSEGGMRVSGTTFPSERQKRVGKADIPEALTFLAESLLDNQGYHLNVRGNANRVRFPFAVQLAVGDLYDSIDTGAVYTVKEVFRDSRTGDKTGEVILSDEHGATAVPGQWHRLRPRDHIRFMHSFPKVLSEPYKFAPSEDDDTNLKQGVGIWHDTITWSVIRREPGGLRRPFEDPRQLKAQHHEYLQSSDLDNCDYFHAVEGQLFDNIVQFDLWATTNERAESLATWFQDFFERYRWVWKYNGVKEILFWQQNSDSVVSRWRNDIVNRSIQLYFQTERLRTFPIRRIVDVEIAVDVLSRGEHLKRPASVVDPSGCIDVTARVPVELIDGPGIAF